MEYKAHVYHLFLFNDTIKTTTFSDKSVTCKVISLLDPRPRSLMPQLIEVSAKN